jgi:hypothetical protein
MVDENKDLESNLREGQEKLRLSNAQQQKLMMELNEIREQSSGSQQQNDEFKRKIQKLLQENQNLGD